MFGYFWAAQFESISDDKGEHVGVRLCAINRVDWHGEPKLSILLQVLFRFRPEFPKGDWICNQLKHVIEVLEERTDRVIALLRVQRLRHRTLCQSLFFRVVPFEGVAPLASDRP